MDVGHFIDELKRGRGQAFSEIVKRYQRPLYQFLSTWNLNHEQKQDILQDIFMKVYTHINSFDSQKASFSTWVFTLAKYQAINLAQTRRTREEKHSELHANWEEAHEMKCPLEEKEQRECLRRALAQLPEEFKNVVILSFFNELSLQEIAEIENLPLGTVKSRIFRGKDLLKKLMSSNESEEGGDHGKN